LSTHTNFKKKYAKNGEEMMDILVDDIDRYEQLSNREELLALASALAGNGAVLEVVHTLDPIDPVDVTGIPVLTLEMVCLQSFSSPH
jgi:hypothetical protein